MATVIKTCTCKHQSQDELHGNNKRVHNSCSTKTETKEYTCTVCGTKRK